MTPPPTNLIQSLIKFLPRLISLVVKDCYGELYKVPDIISHGGCALNFIKYLDDNDMANLMKVINGTF